MSRLLLIEDDPLTGETLQALLNRRGHQVTWARHGREALARLQEAPVDLVLTDILMPEMDGLESILELRSRHPELPVVAMSGHVDTPYLHTATLLGAVATLAKPFTVEALEGVLGRVMTRA